MTLGEKLKQDYVTAYKGRDTVRLNVLRLIKTAMANRLVELKQPGGELDDDAIMAILLKQAKQRRDSIEQYAAAGRTDLAAKEEAELGIIDGYLPKPLDASELDAAIVTAIQEEGACGPKDTGKVISNVMAKFRGRVDGKEVSFLVRKKLGGQAGV